MKFHVWVYPIVAFLFFALPKPWTHQIAFAACETKVLRVNDPLFHPSRFGWDIDMDGDYIVVGAPEDDEIASAAGAAYVIRKDGADWVVQAKLTASDGIFQDNFGQAVDIEGDVIVVGAPHLDLVGQGAGKAYVFRRNINETPIHPEDDYWEEEAILTATNPREAENLGISVSISGNTVVLGTSGVSLIENRALVFQYGDSEWIETAMLVNSDTEPEDGFGQPVQIHSNIIAVGAPLDDDPMVGLRAGSAYIFRKKEDRWIEETKLTASDIHRSAFFGVDLAFSNSQLVIGARFNDNSPGEAYIFQKIDNTWIETDKLTPLDGTSGDEFGSNVDILNDTLLVGSKTDGYIYRYDNDSWVFHEKITPSTIESKLFGIRSLTLSNNHALIGSHGKIVIYRIHEDCLTLTDFAEFQLCFGRDTSTDEECSRFDLVLDQMIDIDDFQAILPLIQNP